MLLFFCSALCVENKEIKNARTCAIEECPTQASQAML